MLIKLWQLNAVSHVKQLYYRLFSTRKVMTGKSLNRSLLCLPMKKHLLNSPSLMLQDISCSLTSCLQLYSSPHLLPQRGEKLGTVKAIPPEVPTPGGPLMEHRTPSTLPTTCLGRHILLWAHHTHQRDCKPPSINWPKTWIFTYQHPDNLRSLMSVALGPSSWLIFTALHPLEHSSVTENKLTTANQFINRKHVQNIHPPFKYSRSKDLAVSYLRNLKCLSHKLCLEKLLQLLSRQKSVAFSFYMRILQAKNHALLLQPRVPLSAYSLDVRAIGTYHLRLACLYPQQFSLLLKQLFHFSGLIKRLFFRLFREIYHLQLPAITTFQLNNRLFVLLL